MYEKAFFHRRVKLFRVFFEYVCGFTHTAHSHTVTARQMILLCMYIRTYVSTSRQTLVMSMLLPGCSRPLSCALAVCLVQHVYMFECVCAFVCVHSAWMQYHERVRAKKQKEKQQIAVALLHHRRSVLRANIVQWKVRMGASDIAKVCSDVVETHCCGGMS